MLNQVKAVPACLRHPASCAALGLRTYAGPLKQRWNQIGFALACSPADMSGAAAIAFRFGLLGLCRETHQTSDVPTIDFRDAMSIRVPRIFGSQCQNLSLRALVDPVPQFVDQRRSLLDDRAALCAASTDSKMFSRGFPHMFWSQRLHLRI